MRRARSVKLGVPAIGLRMAGGDESGGKVFTVNYQIAVQAKIFIPLGLNHIDAHGFTQLGSKKITCFFRQLRFLETPAFDRPCVDSLQANRDIVTKYGGQHWIAQRDGTRIGLGAIMDRNIDERRLAVKVQGRLMGCLSATGGNKHYQYIKGGLIQSHIPAMASLPRCVSNYFCTVTICTLNGSNGLT